MDGWIDGWRDWIGLRNGCETILESRYGAWRIVVVAMYEWVLWEKEMGFEDDFYVAVLIYICLLPMYVIMCLLVSTSF